VKMTFDADVCAAYIRLAPRIGTVADSWPLDGHVAGLDVIIDLDAERTVLGVELLGRIGEVPERILEAIASGAVAEALTAEGFDVPALRGNPEITVQFLG